HRLRALLAGTPPADPGLAHRFDVVRARRSDRFTRFDGNLAGLAVPSPAEHVTSATRLERWAGCPFAYFVHDVLGVEPVENPEEQLRISAIDRGELVHRALEGFILEVLDRPPGDQPAPDQPWSPGDRARLLTIADQLCRDYE